MKNKKKQALVNVTRDINQYGIQKGIPGFNKKGLSPEQIEYLIRISETDAITDKELIETFVNPMRALASKFKSKLDMLRAAKEMNNLCPVLTSNDDLRILIARYEAI